MGQCLVIANQTLGGAPLERALAERIARGVEEFVIVVPATDPEHEATMWSLDFPIDGDLLAAVPQEMWEEDERRRKLAAAEAQRRAEIRLGHIVDRITALGGNAQGSVGDSNPLTAAHQILERAPFDEVVISTLPAGISRWLKMDLPNRIARITDIPVTTIVAEPAEV